MSNKNGVYATLEETGELTNLNIKIEEVLQTNPKALTLLIASGNNFNKSNLDPVLKELEIPVTGGIFHKIIFDKKLLDKGTTIIAWYKDVTVINYKNIENTDSIRDLVGTTSHTSENKDDNGEHLIIIDGAVSKLEENLDALYKKNGFRATFSGGGAGLGSLESSPCIVSNEGLLKNVMQTIAINHRSEITVTHGWDKESGPHLVTSADRTSIKTLNYQPVISYYKNHHKNLTSKAKKNKVFKDIFMEYSVGIENIDGALLVRSSIKQKENSIEYIGNIPEYSKVHILGGTAKSARKNVDKELVKLKLKDEKLTDATFIFSCALRDDADEKGHSKEIKMINKHLINSRYVVGALSLGEIATSQSRLLQLHSKSIVITRLKGVA